MLWGSMLLSTCVGESGGERKVEQARNLVKRDKLGWVLGFVPTKS